MVGLIKENVIPKQKNRQLEVRQSQVLKNMSLVEMGGGGGSPSFHTRRNTSKVLSYIVKFIVNVVESFVGSVKTLSLIQSLDGKAASQTMLIKDDDILSSNGKCNLLPPN